MRLLFAVLFCVHIYACAFGKVSATSLYNLNTIL